MDDAPGVRACTEPVREGMKVEHMNASPSLGFDVMRATDFVGGPFTPPGFYYKTFIGRAASGRSTRRCCGTPRD